MIIIRQATWLDAMHITAMWLKMHHEITTRTALLKENSDTKSMFNVVVARLNDPDWIILIAEDEKKICGFIMGKVHWPLYTRCHIVGTCESLYIYPEHRGANIHTLLIEEATKMGKEKGAIEFEFICMNDKRILAMYDKLGFEPVQVVLRQKEII